MIEKAKQILSRKYTIPAIKLLLLGIVFYYIAESINSNLAAIRDYRFYPDYKFLIPALLLWVVTNLYPVTAWRKLLAMLGGRIQLSTAMRIWFTANIGRYIPGGIWVFAGLVVMVEKVGISKRIALQAMIYSQATSNLLGLAFILLLLSSFYNPWLLTIALVCGLALLSPRIFTSLINFLLRIAKRSPLEKQLSFSELSYYFFLQMINWLLIGLTFFLFLRSFVQVSLFEHLELLIIMPACWTAAFLTLIAPGGLGVREKLLSVLLTPIIGPAPAIVLPWLHRIIQTIIELLLALFFWVCGNKTKRMKH